MVIHTNTIKSRYTRGTAETLPLPKHGSAAVSELAYIKDLQILIVRYKGGKAYAYEEVPQGKVSWLKRLAKNNRRIGSYVITGIRDQHEVRRINI